jgi:DNA polymerase-3 subunit delta'
MTWTKAIGQERIKEILQKAILDGRVPHAYCFWGDEGIGKEAIALEFAKTMNCEHPLKNGDNVEYCGVCSSCQLAASLSHPNIELIFSTPAAKPDGGKETGLKNKQIDEITSQLQIKSENYYHKIEVKGGNMIRIGSIRNLRKKLSMSQGICGHRVIIVSRAEEMTTESANAFLKTLEEPHDNVTIILTTSRKEMLLPTILSRCQVIHFSELMKEDIANYINNYYNISPDDAVLAASFSQGSLTRAIDFISEDMQAMREEAINMLRTALKKREYKINLSKSIDELTKDKSKRKVEQFLNILLLWVRDVEVYKNTLSEEHLINSDQKEIFEKFIKAFGNANIASAIFVIENAIGRIRRNVPLNLLLLSMFIELRIVLFNNTEL